MTLPYSAQELLEAMDGFAYAVDGEGVILAVSGGPSQPVALTVTRGPWSGGSVVGTNIFAYLHGADVIDSYRTLHRAIWSRGHRAIGFGYRCDSPAVERHMRMSLSLIRRGEEPAAVLYQSTIITETHRVPLPLFAAELLTARGAATSGATIVKLCAYCQKVDWPGAVEAEPEWIEAMEFYRRGGGTDIAISHAVCAPCFASIVAPAAGPAPP